MKHRSIFTLSAAAAVLALAACSSSPEPHEPPPTTPPSVEEPAEAPTVEEPETAPLSGLWAAESYSGAVMLVEWDIAPTDERVAALEEFRVATGAAPVSYTAVDIDNRQGTEYQNLYPSQIFDEAGAATDLIDAAEATSLWAPQTIWADDGETYHSVNAAGDDISDEEAVALNEQWSALETPSGAEVGQRITIILVGPVDLPETAAAVLLRDASAYPAQAGEEG